MCSIISRFGVYRKGRRELWRDPAAAGAKTKRMTSGYDCICEVVSIVTALCAACLTGRHIQCFYL